MMQTTAWIASALVFATFYMRCDLHMRAVAVLANLAFIAYALLGLQDGIFDKVLPIFVLHVSALALNANRLSKIMAARSALLPSPKREEIGCCPRVNCYLNGNAGQPDDTETHRNLPAKAGRQKFFNRCVLLSEESA
jgi:hypothetical protein